MIVNKKRHLIYITAGSVPHNKSLIASQVIPMLKDINEGREFDNVELINVVPIVALAAKFKGVSVAELFDGLPFGCSCIYSLLWANSKLAYLFKNRLIKTVARKVLCAGNFDCDEIIIHARSYMATDIALEVKKRLPEKTIKIVFDMRSILSQELALMWKKFGVLVYGSLKCWESYLLSNSDVNLLTVKRGIQLLELENPNNPFLYIPIQGFSTNHDFSMDEYTARWENKKICYIGSLINYYSPISVSKIFNVLEKKIHEVQMKIITPYSIVNNSISKWPQESIPYHDMKSKYEGMLATLVVAMSGESCFMRQKLSSNFFSTKAVESLSVGVPLIVDEALIELSDFVREHECGVVFSFSVNGSVTFNGVSDFEIDSNEFWTRLTENAFKAGEIFRRANVLSKYLEIYNNLLGRR